MKGLPGFTRLPSQWILDGGLKTFTWSSGGGGADNLAALMTLTVIANHIEEDHGFAELTYAQLSDMASLSRTKISNGLDILAERELIERAPGGRSTFRLTNYDKLSGWAAFPAKGLYQHSVVSAFTEFRLRRPAELEALKLYYLFAAKRSRDTNMAAIGYEKIVEQSGVQAGNIRRALTVLGVSQLVHVERIPSKLSEFGFSNGYRLAHLNTRQHMGTTGRGLDLY